MPMFSLENNNDINEFLKKNESIFLSNHHYWAIFDDFDSRKVLGNRSHSRVTTHSVILKGQKGIREIYDAKYKSNGNNLINNSLFPQKNRFMESKWVNAK